MAINFPCDEISEKTVLGVILMDSDNNASIINELTSEDFYADNEKNKLIFSAMKSLLLSGNPIDIQTVYTSLNERKQLNIIGGIDYLTNLTTYVTGYKNVSYYISILKKTTILRQYLMTMEEALKEYSEKPIEDSYDFVNKYQNRFNEISLKKENGDFDSLTDIANTLETRIESTVGNENSVTGYKTGFSNLDKKINGLNKGNMIIIAGRPGMGKSTLSLNIAYNVAKNTRKTVLYFSLEMESDRLVTKLFSRVGHVDSKRIDNGYLTNEERVQLAEAKNKLVNVPLLIDSKRSNSMEDIIIKSKKILDRVKEIGLIVVDHIGITDKEKGMRFNSTIEELEYKSRLCKKMAGELNTPVICVCQLNRNVEVRESKLPQISDLRGSGNLEQDADQVLLLYSDKYYEKQGIAVKKKGNNSINTSNKENENNNDSSMKPQQNRLGDPKDGQLVSVNIAKNRSGEMGKCFLYFFPQFSSFEVPADAATDYFEKIYEDDE